MGFDTSMLEDVMQFDLDSIDSFTGRQTIISNASTIVQFGLIGLGLFFLITALLLIAGYATSIGGSNNNFGRSYGSWFDYENFADTNDRKDGVPDWVLVLEELERALQLYGVDPSNRHCQKRLVCEAYQPQATAKNLSAAIAITDVIRRLSPPGSEEPLKGPAMELLKAAHDGRHKEDCSAYQHKCTKHSLDNIRKKNNTAIQ